MLCIETTSSAAPCKNLREPQNSRETWAPPNFELCIAINEKAVVFFIKFVCGYEEKPTQELFYNADFIGAGKHQYRLCS